MKEGFLHDFSSSFFWEGKPKRKAYANGGFFFSGHWILCGKMVWQLIMNNKKRREWVRDGLRVANEKRARRRDHCLPLRLWQLLWFLISNGFCCKTLCKWLTLGGCWETEISVQGLRAAFLSFCLFINRKRMWKKERVCGCVYCMLKRMRIKGTGKALHNELAKVFDGLNWVWNRKQTGRTRLKQIMLLFCYAFR